MFDLRYHVTSLAAVFIALVIGILVGVALASHGLGNTERKSLEDDLRRAQNRVDALNARVDALQQNGAASQTFVNSTYSALMSDRLKGKPPQAIEKILQGMLDKFYQSYCLVDQGFVKKNSEISVKEHVGSVAKHLGDEITIRRFVRFQVGEGAAA